MVNGEKCGLPSHDLWRWGGLGKTAETVYEAIGDGSTIGALGDRLHMTRPAVLRQVRRLIEAGLIERSGEELRRLLVDLDQVAAARRILGARLIQQAQHRRERRLYREAGEERRRRARR